MQLSKEKYARKRIHNGCSVRTEKSASLVMPNSYPVTDFSIRTSQPLKILIFRILHKEIFLCTSSFSFLPHISLFQKSLQYLIFAMQLFHNKLLAIDQITCCKFGSLLPIKSPVCRSAQADLRLCGMHM